MLCLFVLVYTMLNCSLSVCENDSLHMSERCLTDVFVELLKTKKHVRAFLHMLKSLEK